MPVANAVETVSVPKRQIVYSALIFIIASIAWLTRLAPIQTKTYEVISVEDRLFALEIARTPLEREKGLAGRDGLESNSGMIFYFEKAERYCFWMKDTRIPLDILWLDAEGLIVHSVLNARPESYPETYCPDVPANRVVELPAGAVAPKRLMIGQRLQL